MMPEYRAYLIGPDGHFHSSSAIEARDDEGISASSHYALKTFLDRNWLRCRLACWGG